MTNNTLDIVRAANTPPGPQHTDYTCIKHFAA